MNIDQRRLSRRDGCFQRALEILRLSDGRAVHAAGPRDGGEVGIVGFLVVAAIEGGIKKV